MREVARTRAGGVRGGTDACAWRALLNGRLGISPEMVIRLSEAFGGSPESWLTQQMQYDLWHAQHDREPVDVRRFATA